MYLDPEYNGKPINNFERQSISLPSPKKLSLFTASFFGSIGALGIKYDFMPSSVSYAFLGVSFLSLALESCTSKKSAANVIQIHDAPKEHVSWDEMDFLMGERHVLGFRHVNHLDKAKQECRQGFYGDSLNLDVTHPGSWAKFMPNDTPCSNGFTERDRLLMSPDKISPETKEALVQFWETGISNFIESPWLTSSSAFLVIDYGPGQKYRAYDFHYGGGLGKMGKQQVSKERIVAIIHPPATALSGPMLIDYYLSALVIALRAYMQKEK